VVTQFFRETSRSLQRRADRAAISYRVNNPPLLAPNFRAENFEENHEFLHWLARVKSDRQRQILAWTYDGATPTEIAAELDMHPATVRSTLRNVRAALRRLRAEGGEQE
jgi:RNA polymerase sigma factor (sigma-70 family)